MARGWMRLGNIGVSSDGKPRRRRALIPILLSILGLLGLCSYIAPKSTAHRVDLFTWTAVTNEMPGCADQSQYERLMDLIASHDLVAINRFLATASARGECVTLKAGSVVYLQERSLRYVCLRPRGDPRCVWALRAAID